MRAALAMEAGDAFEIAFGDFAGEFVGEGGDVFFGEEGRLLRGGGESGGEEKRDGEQGAVHAGHSSGDWGEKPERA